jgi:hypothetical protein
MREPLEIIYRNLGNKLGNPKEFKNGPDVLKPPEDSENNPQV